MRETQRNIRNYKRKLVGVKEKLATAGLLFLMSAVMLTTASFAWITLSIHPEVKGISTTVVGNGNLEIALAHTSDDGNLHQPASSQVGDSNLPLVDRNNTWGNLVNLNDPSYGLDKVSLKPATLYTSNLLESPLIAVKYDKDGRVFESEYNFQYSNYNPALNNNTGAFEVTDIVEYGVRAISSVSQATDNTEVAKATELMIKIKRETGDYYLNTIDAHKDVLSEIIGKFVSDKARATSLGDGKKADYRGDMNAIISFMEDFLDCIDQGILMYDQFAKIQYKGDPEDFPYSTFEELISKGQAGLKPQVPEMEGLDKLITMRNSVITHINSLKTINEDTTTYPVVNWDHISNSVNYVVHVNSCVINDEYIVGNISASMAMDMLPSIQGGNNTGEIKSGALVDFEKIIGTKINLDVTIKSYMGFNSLIGLAVKLDKNKNLVIDARVYTSSNAPFTSDVAIEGIISKLNDGMPIIWKADDVYGLVLDFWVRTNMSDTFLILEGKPKVEMVVADTKIDGIDYVLYRNNYDTNVYYHIPDSANKYSGERVFDEGISNAEMQTLMSGDFVNNLSGQYVAFDEEDITEVSVSVGDTTPGLKYEVVSEKLSITPVSGVSNPKYEYKLALDDEWIELTGASLDFSKEEKSELVTFYVRHVYGENSYSDVSELEVNFDEINKTRTGFVNNLSYVEETVVTGYDGVNRVWQEGTDLDENSATQGKGSCYIFYPNDPIEQEKMLKLLRGVSVAFLDALNGNKLLSVAKLNVDYAYEENGKVIVPLELDPYYSNSVKVESEDVLYVTTLTQNQAQMISAIVYIDGKQISNVDVEATNSVEGYLNLQFGSTEELINLEDDEVKNAEYVVNAGLGDNNVDVIETAFDPNRLPNVKVNVTVGGVTPSEVKVNFIRKINDKQGVKSEEVVLSGSGSNWSGNVTFERPGNYVLRSAWIDGDEYEFVDDKELQVNIQGFNIQSISWDEDSSKKYYMGSEVSYSTLVYATFGADDTYQPTEVKGLFRNSENNSYVTVNFRNNNGIWTGRAVFNRSGTYVLETLMINNEAYSVDESMKKTITLYLGISAVVNAEPTSIVYEGESVDVRVTANIYDNTGKPMNDLSNTFLRYNQLGSESNYLLSELTWDNQEEAFVGLFHMETPGTYRFKSIGINKELVTDIEQQKDTLSSYLYVAQAPAISLIPKEPPSYVANHTLEKQFAPNDDATFVVDISNSGTAIGAAVMTNSNTGQTVTMTIPDSEGVKETLEGSTVTTWNIPIMEFADSSQNGTWTLDKIYLTNVYANDHLYEPVTDASGNYVWDENNGNFLTFDLEAENISAYVMNDIKVTIDNSDDTAFTPQAVIFNTTLDGHHTRNHTMIITDWWGKSIEPMLKVDLNNTRMTYVHDIGSYSNWWPNWSNEINSTYVKPTAQYNVTDDPNTFALASDLKFYYPGTYNSRLEISFIDETGNNYYYIIDSENIISSDTAKFVTVPLFAQNEEIKWIQPDVVFNDVKFDYYTQMDAKRLTYSTSKVSTNIGLGTIFPTKNQNGITIRKSDKNSIEYNGKVAKIYSYVTVDTYGGILKSYDGASFTSPKVNLALKNVDVNTLEGASITISDTINSTYSKTFTFAANTLFSNYLEMGNVQSYYDGLTGQNNSIGLHTTRISDGSKGSQVSITTGGKTYNFIINGDIEVDYDY